MNINSMVDGAMNSAPIMATATVPGKTMGSPQPVQQTGGNGAGGNGDVSPAQVKEIVADLQNQLDSMNVSLQYNLYGENSEKISVKVVDKVTGSVIREIPSKEMQSLQTKMSELVGMIFNGKG